MTDTQIFDIHRGCLLCCLLVVVLLVVDVRHRWMFAFALPKTENGEVIVTSVFSSVFFDFGQKLKFPEVYLREVC